MFIAEVRRNPDQRERVAPRCVRQELTEMAVIRPFQLILNHNYGRVICFSQDVDRKGADPGLRLD